jgi:hypothetical protein
MPGQVQPDRSLRQLLPRRPRHPLPGHQPGHNQLINPTGQPPKSLRSTRRRRTGRSTTLPSLVDGQPTGDALRQRYQRERQALRDDRAPGTYRLGLRDLHQSWAVVSDREKQLRILRAARRPIPPIPINNHPGTASGGAPSTSTAAGPATVDSRHTGVALYHGELLDYL